MSDEPKSLVPGVPAFVADPVVDELLCRAVDIITNVNAGYWNQQTVQWRDQAATWMRDLHQLPAAHHQGAVLGVHPSDHRAAELVFAAIGEASTCWEGWAKAKTGGFGVFESDRAAEVGRRLLESLGFRVPSGYELRPPEPDIELMHVDAARVDEIIAGGHGLEDRQAIDVLGAIEPEAGEREGGGE